MTGSYCDLRQSLAEVETISAWIGRLRTVAESRIGCNRIAGQISYGISDHQEVPTMLVQNRVGLRVGGIGIGIVNYLIHCNNVAGLIQTDFVHRQIVQGDEKDPGAEGGRVNRSREADCDAGLNVES